MAIIGDYNTLKFGERKRRTGPLTLVNQKVKIRT